MKDCDYAVIQISVNHLDGKPITKDQLRKMNARLNECCSSLEKDNLGFISASLCLGEDCLSTEELED